MTVFDTDKKYFFLSLLFSLTVLLSLAPSLLFVFLSLSLVKHTFSSCSLNASQPHFSSPQWHPGKSNRLLALQCGGPRISVLIINTPELFANKSYSSPCCTSQFVSIWGMISFPPLFSPVLQSPTTWIAEIYSSGLRLLRKGAYTLFFDEWHFRAKRIGSQYNLVITNNQTQQWGWRVPF